MSTRRQVDTMVASVSVDADQPVAARTVRSRRQWSDAAKRRLVALTYQAGVSVAQIARLHGGNDNLLFTWRRQLGRTELLPAPGAGPAPNFAVVDVVADVGRQERRSGAGVIESELTSGTRVRVLSSPRARPAR